MVLAEVQESRAAAIPEYPGFPALRAILAVAYCEVGKGERAEELMKVDAVDGFDAVPYDCFWLYGLVAFAEACAARRALAPARALYGRLAPWHRQLPTIPPVANGGAVALYLGMLATVLDRFDDAEAHYAEAMEIHERLQTPYWIARTQLEQARMLLDRNGEGDNTRAALLLDQVNAAAAEYGFVALARHAADLRP